VEAVAGLTGQRPQEIDVRLPFLDLGLDSVHLIKIAGNLERWLRRELSATLAYDYPTIELVARHLAAGSGC
jgi:acyl carrier protein